MSTTLLRVFPADTNHVPTAAAQTSGEQALRQLLPAAHEIHSEVHEEPAFIDQGENFDQVLCPACGKELDMEWWQDAMGSAGESSFMRLAVTTPCCSATTSLNDLDYRFPAGFARYVLEAIEPNIRDLLDQPALIKLEQALGTPVRQTIARY